MPTNVVYRRTYSEGVQQYRITIIPRAASDLPGGYSVEEIPADIILGWKISGASFPGERPWGMISAPTLEIELNYSNLGRTSALQDLRTYLQSPISADAFNLTTAGESSGGMPDRFIDASNVLVLERDYGTGTFETEFVGMQRVIPGEEYTIEGAGSASARVKATVRFAHALLYTCEQLKPGYLREQVLADESPIQDDSGNDYWLAAYNLIYYKASTNRLWLVRESTADRFKLYSYRNLYWVHLQTILDRAYDYLLRDAYGAATIEVASNAAGGRLAPAVIHNIFEPDYDADDYAKRGSRELDLSYKGIIEDVSSNELGGWLSEHSAVSIFQWENLWDMLRDESDVCQTTFWHDTPESATLFFGSLNENNSGASVTLTAQDIRQSGVTLSRQKGIIKGAQVDAQSSGSADFTAYQASADGIESEEEVTLKVPRHNAVPLFEGLTHTLLDETGYFASSGPFDHVSVADIETYTTHTLYLVKRARHDASATNLSDEKVPILVWPGVDIMTIESTTFSAGYDLSEVMPLPQTLHFQSGAFNDTFYDQMEGAMIALQQLGSYPRVIAQMLVWLWGAGSTESANAAFLEIEVGGRIAQTIKLKHLGCQIAFDPDELLAPGESWFTGLTSTNWRLVGYEPRSDGSASLQLFGY